MCIFLFLFNPQRLRCAGLVMCSIPSNFPKNPIFFPTPSSSLLLSFRGVHFEVQITHSNIFSLTFVRVCYEFGFRRCCSFLQRPVSVMAPSRVAFASYSLFFLCPLPKTKNRFGFRVLHKTFLFYDRLFLGPLKFPVQKGRELFADYLFPVFD